MLWIKDCWAGLGCYRGGSGTGINLSGGLLYNAYQTKLATLNYTKPLSDTPTERGVRGGGWGGGWVGGGAVCSPIKDQILCFCLLTQQVWSGLELWFLHHLVSCCLGHLSHPCSTTILLAQVVACITWVHYQFVVLYSKRSVTAHQKCKMNFLFNAKTHPHYFGFLSVTQRCHLWPCCIVMSCSTTAFHQPPGLNVFKPGEKSRQIIKFLS